jgi:ribonuclease HI
MSAATPKRKRVDHKFYAVRVGNKPGIYHSWTDCQEQVRGFKGAICKPNFTSLDTQLMESDKSFTSLTAADSFLQGSGPAKLAATKFYAIRHGHVPGVYTDWPEAQKQITGFIKPKHKSFFTRIEAEAYLKRASPPPPTTPTALTATASPPAEASLTPVEDAGSDLPPAKRAKRSQMASAHIAAEDAAGFPPGYGLLPPGGEDLDWDSFDFTIKMDAIDGGVRRKTAAEMDATKAVKAASRPPASGEDEWIKVWTDGACRANGKRSAAAGVGVWFGPDDPRCA